MKLARHVCRLMQTLEPGDLQDMTGAERIGLRQECERVLRMVEGAAAVEPPKAGVLAQLHEGARAD